MSALFQLEFCFLLPFFRAQSCFFFLALVELNRGRGELTEFGIRGAQSSSTQCLGQYKTSLLGCHRKFVHFLLHLAAILLDKHCTRLARFKHFH